MCERCRQTYAMICLNGERWLCWTCYVQVVQPPSQAPATTNSEQQ